MEKLILNIDPSNKGKEDKKRKRRNYMEVVDISNDVIADIEQTIKEIEEEEREFYWDTTEDEDENEFAEEYSFYDFDYDDE